MKLTTEKEVKQVFANYPKHVKPKMAELRELIIESAEEIEQIEELEETLKWGEPSYLTKNGSTVRIDWKEKNPDSYSVFFKCTSKLVPTFKKLYADDFYFEGDREIRFKLNARLPKRKLKKCIKAALMYHKVKQLPDLGIT